MRRFVAIILVLLSVAGAFGAEENRGYYREPALRGERVVFVSEGDLWEVGVDGGLAHSLTSHVAPAQDPWISPDGGTVAFTGTYEGPPDVYTMPITGGRPTRLTFEGYALARGWTGSGKVIAAGRARATLPTRQLFTIDPSTRAQTYAPLYQASEGVYDDGGNTLFFTRFVFQGSQTKRYQGGTAQNIWKYRTGAAEAEPLTSSYAGTSKNPMWWNGHVYFLTDRDGTMNVWSMDESGGHLKQITHSVGWDVGSASLDKGRIVYQLGPDIHLCDAETGQDRVIDIRLASDFDATLDTWVSNPLGYMTASSTSPDGSSLVLTARGQVFVAPATEGRFVEVTRKQGVRYRNAIFSSDGKSVYALSDETGETEWWKFPANGVGAGEQISRGANVLVMNGSLSPDGKHLAYSDKNWNVWILDLGTKAATKIATCADGMPDELRWSPDSQWLSYTFPTISFNKVVLYSLQSGKNLPVTSGRSDASSACWSADGKWLYFLSDRTFRSSVGSPWGPRQPEPYFDKRTKIYLLGLVKGLRSPFQPFDEVHPAPTEPPAPRKGPVSVTVDPDGIEQRQWEAPVPPGNYGQLFANGDRLFVQSATAQGPDLVAIDLKNTDQIVHPLASQIQNFELSADGKKLTIRKGDRFFIVPSGAPVAALEKPVDLSAWTIRVQPREEWRQMFIEAWRLERDYFYDPNMHGVDWKSVLARYLPTVDRVNDRDELSDLITQMVGELSSLHTFVYGGDERQTTGHVFPASLGAVLTRSQALGGYRVDRIYRSDPDYPDSASPLAKPGVDVKEGDVIESVDGMSTLDAPDISALLRLKAHKQVLLHVKEGVGGRERDCIAVPFAEDEARDLRYNDWELDRRRRVESAGGGQIGYVHLRAMSSADIARWERDFYPVFDRAGLILDVRHNNGGNIDSWIIEKLMRQAWFYWQGRVGNPTWNMQWAFRGHVVVLCDESTASDGEAVTEGIKRLKLGKVIGTRTWGGGIWLTSSNILEDLGIATAAEFGVYGPEGKWLVEGHGVEPDIIVDNLPHSTFDGKDAQLEAAIAYLQQEIKEHPVPVPPAPKHPIKAFRYPGGTGGSDDVGRFVIEGVMSPLQGSGRVRRA